MDTSNESKENKLGALSRWILVIAFLCVLFSFFAPSLFTQCGILDFRDTGEIGDTLGGIMNPFIALAGVLLTFVAFYIQFQANQQQRKDFNKEIKLQQEQFQRNQLENQFYQMLHIHKDNVDALEITQIKTHSTEKVQGRRVFDFLLVELEIGIHLAKLCFNSDTDREKTWVEMGYDLFFLGIRQDALNRNPNSFYTFSQKFSTFVDDVHYHNPNSYFSNTYSPTPKHLKDFPRYKLFEGQTSQLAHYYRHLFQTVKFIARLDEELISYEQKRNYIRMLRAQLSNSEQTLLLYNWWSGFGLQWENSTNHFFTDYRIIHNIYNDLLYEGFKLEDIEEFKRDPRKEKDRKFDPLFEFDDWEHLYD